MTDIIVKSKIKEVCKGYNVASDLADELNKAVEHMLKQACERAKANGRKTVMGKDV
jgi:histone H3/H4